VNPKNKAKKIQMEKKTKRYSTTTDKTKVKTTQALE